MKVSSFSKIFLLVGGLMLLGLMGCSKGSSSPAPAAVSYTTCPATGYYVYNGTNTACTPGTSVPVTTTGTTMICPPTGYYPYNGINTPCTPGTTVMTGTVGTTTTCPATGTYVMNGMTYTCTPGSIVSTGSITGMNNVCYGFYNYQGYIAYCYGNPDNCRGYTMTSLTTGQMQTCM